MEEIKFSKKTGELYTDRTWNYKIFGAKDIPHDFRVYLSHQMPNPVGILGGKSKWPLLASCMSILFVTNYIVFMTVYYDKYCKYIYCLK